MPRPSELQSEPSAEPGGALRERTAELGRRLAASLAAVHAHALGGAAGPKRAAELLGQPVPMASRLLKALGEHDPIALVHKIPGPDPLRRWLRAARRRSGEGSAEREALREALAAVDEFEALIQSEAGDRGALDALLASWLPDARRSLELRRRQSVFRGLSELRGTWCELELTALLLHPAREGDGVDLCCVQARGGLVSLRPGIRTRFVTERLSSGPRERNPTNLDGEPSIAALERIRLDGFCSSAPAEVDVAREGDRVQYLLSTRGFGPNSPADFVVAEVNRDEFRRGADPVHAPFFHHVVQVPAKRAVIDVIVHPDLAPPATPAVAVYDVSGETAARPGDRLREVDRIDAFEQCQDARGELRSRSTPGLPRYGELLEHVTARLGWRNDAWRTFRLEMEYPVPGTQLSLVMHGARFEFPAS